MKQLCTQIGIELSAEQEQKFEKLLELFIKTNSQINLSAIREPQAIKAKHFIDSVLPAKLLNTQDYKKVLDLGAGGGFPCLPLSIIYPELKIHALDSVGKKMKAVQNMADELNLNLKTHHGRIEDFGQNKTHREQYDLVTARALAPWPVLLEYTLPFVKIGGTFLAYQGPAIEDDLITFKNLENKLGGTIIDTHKLSYIFEDETIERIFIEIKKTKPTSKKYPRLNGIPRQEPLS